MKMVCCSGPNCKNSFKNFKMYRFPSDPERRLRWAINTRRNWGPNQPTSNMKLCEVHFEESQFELKRQDGKKRLKWNAVPTLFDVPNPPKLMTVTRPKPNRRLPLETKPTSRNKEVENIVESVEECICKFEVTRLKLELKAVREERRLLKIKIAKLEQAEKLTNEKLNRFLRPDQLKYLQRRSKKNPLPWSEETLNMALRLQCALGIKGYKVLRNEGFPLPTYRTLHRRMKGIQIIDVSNAVVSVPTRNESSIQHCSSDHAYSSPSILSVDGVILHQLCSSSLT